VVYKILGNDLSDDPEKNSQRIRSAGEQTQIEVVEK
jgi:hypothetical protein